MAAIRFQDLYREHAPELVRFAHWLCGDRHDAEDLVAEAFVRAFAGSDAIEARTVKGYLLAIVRNLHLEQLRRRRPTVVLDAAIESPVEGPATAAETAQYAQRLGRALAALGEPDRSALLMRAEAALPYEEIAAVLGLSVANAKVKVHRARRKLANEMKEDNP
jgi:RNA polymerase sigma-70 factor (ECF subfamily)